MNKIKILGSLLCFAVFVVSCESVGSEKRYYYKNGKIKIKVETDKQGRYHGEYVEYSSTGYLSKRTHYEHGELEGTSETFVNNKISKKSTYNNGDLVSEILYFPNGNKKRITSFINGTSAVNTFVCFDKIGNVENLPDMNFVILNETDSSLEIEIDTTENFKEIQVFILKDNMEGNYIDTLMFSKNELPNGIISVAKREMKFTSDTATILFRKRLILREDIFEIEDLYIQLNKNERIDRYNSRPIFLE